MTEEQIQSRADEIRQMIIRKLKMDENFARAAEKNGRMSNAEIDEYVLLCNAIRDAI